MAKSQRETGKLAERAFGRLLRQWRTERGLSQERLAELVPCDRSYLSRLERGVNAPTLTVAVEIGNALGIGPAELFAVVGEEIEKVHSEVNAPET
jgi:transcriptional regulator with XRE-family HTH domain